HHYCPLASGFQGSGQWNGHRSSLFFQLLPFVEQDALYRQAPDTPPAPGLVDPYVLNSPMPAVFSCPSDFTTVPSAIPGVTSYQANAKAFGQMWDAGPIARIPAT